MALDGCSVLQRKMMRMSSVQPDNVAWISSGCGRIPRHFEILQGSGKQLGLPS
jgi:hypothetical protein